MKVPIRAFASDRIHVADIPENMLVPMEHVGAPFLALPLPAVMLCGAVLRRRYGYDVAVRMNDDAKVNCQPCKMLAGRW